VEKRCRVLSGGEKARLVMAKMLYDPPNFLVLDEPTHHLDIATKAMLIGARSHYEGAMLLAAFQELATGHAPIRNRLAQAIKAIRQAGHRDACARACVIHAAACNRRRPVRVDGERGNAAL
jgi:ATPase subunit of ABC transporter with duplicated ATPase domains